MQITGNDNRGTNDTPFGFVYFDDHTRVIYADGIGVTPFRGSHWEPATNEHAECALTYLKDKFPAGNWFVKVGD